MPSPRVMAKLMELVFSKIKLFDGNNYDSWKYRVENFMETQGCLEVLSMDKSVETATNKAEVDAWIERDRIAKSIIVALINDEQLEYVRGKDSANAIWNSLNANFCGTNMAKQNMLRGRLDHLKYEIGADMKKHFTKFDEVIRELIASGAKIEKSECMYYLFKSFPEEYQPLITALENVADDVLTMDYAKSRLANEELRRQQKGSNSDNKEAAFATSANFKCYNCNRFGHGSWHCPEKKKKFFKKRNGKRDERKKEENSSYAFCVGGTESDGDLWILDSGSTKHLTNNLESLTNVKKLDKEVVIKTAEKDTKIIATHTGDLKSFTIVDGKKIEIEMNQILFSKEIRTNLMSIKVLQNKKIDVHFVNGNQANLVKDGKIVCKGELSKNSDLYVVKLFPIAEEVMLCNEKLWHRRFGHINPEYLKKMKSEDMVTGWNSGEKIVRCEPCLSGKQAENPYNGHRSPTKRILERVHSDICGPFTPESYDGNRYFVSFIDDYSHFTCVYLLKNKSEVYECFKMYERWVSAKFNVKMACLRSDMGGEYLSSKQKQYCKDKGIVIETTVGYSPKSNRVAERFNRTVVEKARSMIADSQMSKEMWGEAILAATYLLNRSPTNSVLMKTPAGMVKN